MSKCPVCHGVSESKFNGYSRCRSCKTLFLEKFPSNKSISNNNDSDAPERISTNYKEVSSIYSNRLNDLIRHLKGKNILDIGFGNGVFMREARKLGFNVSGVEKPDILLKYMKKKGFKVNKEVKSYGKKSFDAVVSFDVIEHVISPDNFLGEIKSVMKRGAIVMITTPNSQGISGRFMRGKYFVFDPVEHYILFSPASMRTLLEGNGFKILSSTTDTITPWLMPTTKLTNKLINKAVYLCLYPLRRFLFTSLLGDNLEVIAKLK